MTTGEVKNILGEPAGFRPDADASVPYFYCVHNDIGATDYAAVNFDKSAGYL